MASILILFFFGHLSDMFRYKESISNVSIKKAIDRFLHFCLDKQLGDDALEKLMSELDRLANSVHFPQVEDDIDDYPDPPGSDYASIRAVVSERFPELGFYCSVDSDIELLQEAKVTVGDAVDDLADIIGDLKDVQWYFENTSLNQAIWQFQFSYRYHWGLHLRELQLYLHRQLM